MPKLLTLKDGITLTQFARQTIESYIYNNEQLALPEAASKALLEHRGVFVTLKKRDSYGEPEWRLRGCIGHLQPGPNSPHKSISLLEATRQAALSSALQDPRFPPVQAKELDSILVEVSVLTLPEEIVIENRSELSKQISVGKDGLIVEGKGWHRGLLLPQVAPEQNWNAEEFLQGCCQKAGLHPDCYLNPDVKLFKFQAQIFAELVPNGKIVEREF
jgi:uncharacterized protein (TIGR00296 family)